MKQYLLSPLYSFKDELKLNKQCGIKFFFMRRIYINIQ